MIYPYTVNISGIDRFEQIADCCAAVSEERQSKIKRYRFDRDKIRSLTAELLVRYALAEQFGMEDPAVKFLYSTNGKPHLADSDIHFNLSHSGNWVVCAVGKNEIGIDVEEIQQIEYQDIYCSFAENEIQLLNHLEPQVREAAFYQLWTLKESYVKYCGTGLLYPFSDFSVDLQPNGSASLIQTANSITDIRFDSRKLDESHWYALCIPANAQTADIRFVTQQALFHRVR